MLAKLLYELYAYQIFQSVFFRASMGFLTSYFLTSILMPPFIVYMYKKEYVSDLADSSKASSQVPIMGGAVIIFSLVISTFLWAWTNVYVISSITFLVCFGLIGLSDDCMKIQNNKKIRSGILKKKDYSEKSDGISAKLRIILEIVITVSILGITIYFYRIPGFDLQIPMVPIKNWHPNVSEWVYFLMAIFIVVGCANAVNLLDGLDSLVSLPIINTLIFIGSVSYIAGDMEWSEKLKIVFISEDLKELSIFSIIVVGGVIAFLKYNSPPAYIYMGDIGSLGLGASISALFLFAKAELFLPIVGGTFVIAAFSVIVQRLWFFIVLKIKGREYAKKNRFFYKAPYHHHQQAAMSFQEKDIRSVYHSWLEKLKLVPKYQFYKNYNKEKINSKVIWQNHIKAIWFLVIAFLIYFKIR